MQQNYNKKKWLNKLKTSLLMLMMVCFALPVMAQQKANLPDIYMRDGRTLMDPNDVVQFYDSHGPSGPSTNGGTNYWDFWYVVNEQFEYTFKARNATDLILVTFNPFTAYSWNNNYQTGQPNSQNGVSIGNNWSLRINEDILTVYQGESSATGTQIAEFSGNKEGSFTIMATGSITFNFYSNEVYREEGWAATVQCLDGTSNSLTAQPPFIRRATCSNTIEIQPTTVGATIYYTTDGSTPTASSSVYSPSTTIDWPLGSDLTVRAKSSIDGGTTLSDETLMTFNDAYQPNGDRLPNPGVPTITREEGTNVITMKAPNVPSGVNETYIVRYTTDGTQPTYSGNGTTYSQPIVCSEAGTVYTAKAFALSCELASPSVTYTVDQIYCPKPVIDFDQMKITAYDENEAPFYIYYTINGTEPGPSNYEGSGEGTVTLSDLALGTTVKAVAYKLTNNSVDPNYIHSLVVTDIYVGSGSQVTTTTVLLDDREDHSWSYYSDSLQPVHRLNPADVKITYFGNGITMKTNNDYTPTTSSDDFEISTGVAVGVDASANQFIYLKTLENAKENGTGNYPYTLIPNPFSKRPTYGSGESRWRGFQGWRVVRLVGVTIAEGYTVGSIIPAEEEIHFVTTNSKGNEADFQAVWARAYVATSRTTTLSGGSYERNFYVLTGNITDNIASPGTVSRYYPNGTTDGTTLATAAPTTTQNLSEIDINVDTKYEYIALRGTNTITVGDNNYLCFGRGIDAGASAARVQGISSGSHTSLNYTIRVESGNYDRFAFVRNGSATVSGRYIVKAIMGCDYDRARNDNESLLVSSTNDIVGNNSGNNTNGSLFFSCNVTFSGRVNQDVKTFDCVIKSGSYQQTLWKTGTGTHNDLNDGQYNHSLYLGQNQASDSYPGVRYVTIEGGEFASMNGGRASNDMSHASADVVGYYARIKDGIFHGAVFGGAADNNSPGGRSIIITGGTILGWVAGGGNGTGTGDTNSMANINGNSYIYVGGNAIIGNKDDATLTINETLGGQVFGAGRGKVKNNGTSQTASVINSNVVIADNATITSGTQANGGNVYGGGNLGIVTTSSNVYILGGSIQNHVFGGAYGNGNTGAIPTSNVYVKGGTVNGSVYGGSNSSGTVTNSHVTVSGCDKVTNVYGGGLGASTVVGENTEVTVSGGTINNNVYGGGEEGKVTGNTEVTVSGGEMQNVYGAGKGTTNQTANIAGNTEVTISGGKVLQSVYGGGEAGNVNEAGASGKTSTVTVSGGAISGDVFGGGRMGKTSGDAVVTVSGGEISGNVFGGAYGQHGSVYLAGLKTVNITGGHVNGSVYGGSRNANDALTLTPSAFSHFENGNEVIDATDDAPCSITNISGGRIREHVYAAGYYGVTYGSVYGFVGLNAIENAPNHAPTAGVTYNKNILIVGGNVYAGGDWGTFNGTFGAPTVSGNSSVYVDALGYNTTADDPTSEFYMSLDGSLFGCGTSCDAGNKDRVLILKNYGTDIANSGNDATVNPISAGTRTFNSIQRFREVIADNAHVNFTGQGMVNSLNATVEYSIYSIDRRVLMANGSTFVMNAPSTELKSFWSATCNDTYAASPTFTKVNYNGLGATGSLTDNKIRVNGGSYIEILYETTESNATVDYYGELAGWAHMMSSNQSADMTCAYARPKQSQEEGNIIPETYDNSNDGGFVAYRAADNQYTAEGALVSQGNQVQLRYENHTPNMRGDTKYYRIWRYGGNHSTVNGVLNASSVPGGATYYTVEDTIKLPSWRGEGYYYRFETSGDNYLVDYGNDVLTYNAAYAYKAANTADPNAASGSYWMYNNNSEAQVINQPVSATGLAAGLASLADNPNMNFGLVMAPCTGISETTNYIICDEADNWLATNARYTCGDNTVMPSVIFRLTYKNALTANMSWDPVTIPLVQCHMVNGTEVIDDYVDVKLTINTSTQITEGITTTMYALMNGTGGAKEVSQAKLIIPSFPLHESGENAEFIVKKVEFTPGDYDGDDQNGTLKVQYKPHTGQTSFDFNSFGMTIEAVATPDNIDDWRNKQGEIEGAPGNGATLDKVIADAGGRSDLALGINLYYNGNMQFQGQKDYMGRVVFTIVYDNSGLASASPWETQFTITVDVYRRGRGAIFYVDGTTLVDDELLGKDATGYGKFPDKPARTVNYVLNRLGFIAGDNIFVVNTLPITKPSTTWDGSRFQNNVNIYRYPGGHKLSVSDDQLVFHTDDFPNEAFTGTLVDVTSKLNVEGVNMDGMYAEAIATTHNHWLYPTNPEGDCDFNGEAVAPMMVVEDGGTLNLKTTTTLKHNYNTYTSAGSKAEDDVPGGAVNVKRGGILKLNGEAKITDNICEQGGAVYMDGAMIVSDSIYVYNNHAGTAQTSEQSNVWLTQKGADNYRVVQIGLVDDNANYGALKYKKNTEGGIIDTKVGIGKDDWENGTIDGYMPVVYAEQNNIPYLEIPYANPQNLIVHDLNHYKLEKYHPDHYLYWLKTWVTEQYWNPIYASNDPTTGYTPYMTAEQLLNIDTPEKLAWVISLANGENGVDLSNANYTLDNVIVTKDLDMSQYIWVPIGTDVDNFTGNFEGNGHTISGLICPLIRTDAGMFGQTNGATIQNMVVVTEGETFKPEADNVGVVVGTMTGGTLSNVEAAGMVTNQKNEGNTGGLVGTNNGGTIHSSFAVPTLVGGNIKGGLVGVNKGNLYNSYSNVTMSMDEGEVVGGLVGVNQSGCFVENCYANVGEQTFPAFANANSGTIQFCYADKANGYVTTGNGTLAGHGTYAAIDPAKGIKDIDYMYRDNLVSLVGDYTTYVPDVTEGFIYDNNHIPVWDGLLSAMNKWVRTKNSGYTPWSRPKNSKINGDLPVLLFPSDNAMATLDSDGKFLQYSAFNLEHTSKADAFNNGIDGLLAAYNDNGAGNAEPNAGIFLYGAATEVATAPTDNVKVTVDEDAVLMPTVAGFKATVGVTFDNSCKKAVDYIGNTLAYDWHFMSSPLSNAAIGATYGASTGHGGDVNISKLEGSYFPNGLPMTTPSTGVKWDLYTYYEPEYHWINLKRSGDNHWHQDNNDQIHYVSGQAGLGQDQNETIFVPGKGYMMAISQDSYMNSTGTLNNSTVSINLTNQEDLTPVYNKGWNLVGNPYQAYLDLSKVGSGSFYIYDADKGVFAPVVEGSSANTDIPSKYIHPHQGFFMYTAEDATFQFAPSMAGTMKSETGSYYRGREDQVNYPLVNLYAENERGNRDLAVVEFNRPELGGATKVNSVRNANFQIAASLEGQRYGLVFTPEGTERVPVHFITEEDGTFTLTWNTQNGDFTSLLLVDNMTGTITDMLRADRYTFDASKDDYASRFYLTYTVTGVDEYNEGDGSFAFFDGSEWVVNGKGQLDIVDVTGRVLFSKRLANERNRVSLNGVANGVYLMRVTDGKNTMVQKIVVK